MTARQKNYPFSVETLVISDFTTGEPVVARQLAGQSLTLNVSVNTTILQGNEYLAPASVEFHGGNISMDGTLQEVPKKILNYTNQGTQDSTVACASAICGTMTNKTGTSVSDLITGATVSAGQHSNVKNDTIYLEALSSATFKMVNYSKGVESAVLTASGSGGVFDNTVAPGISLSISSAGAGSFETGDTAIFTTQAIHGGIEQYNYGVEKNCASGKYVAIKGIACNKADGDHFEFNIYKALMTGVGAPMQHGEFMTLTIHADAMVDTTQSGAGYMKQIKGA